MNEWRGLLDVDAVDPPEVKQLLLKQTRHPDCDLGIKARAGTVFDCRKDVQASQERIVPSEVGTASAFFRNNDWSHGDYVFLFFPLIRLDNGKIGLRPTPRCYGLVDVTVLSTHTFAADNLDKVERSMRIAFAREVESLISDGFTPCGHMAVKTKLSDPELKLMPSVFTGVKMIHLAQRVASWSDCKRLWNAAECFRRETLHCASYCNASPDLFHAYAFQEVVHGCTIPGSDPPTTAIQQFLLDSTSAVSMSMRGLHAQEVILHNKRYQVLADDPKMFWPDGGTICNQITFASLEAGDNEAGDNKAGDSEAWAGEWDKFLTEISDVNGAEMEIDEIESILGSVDSSLDPAPCPAASATPSTRRSSRRLARNLNKQKLDTTKKE